MNNVDTYLVFVYFLNDPDFDGHKTERELRAAIKRSGLSRSATALVRSNPA